MLLLRHSRWLCWVVALAAGLAGCGSSVSQISGVNNVECDIAKSLIFDGGPGKDGIPALVNPRLVSPDDPGTGYLLNRDRVIGIVVDSQPIAVPLNIGWWHEIVNFDLGGRHLAVTYCPLTGSSLVFDRAAARNAHFGVSGLLYLNNLIMYDRTAQESLWPQLIRGAGCGPQRGTSLEMWPALEMTWAGWKSLYPSTRVVSAETGFARDYTQYPYGDYDRPGNTLLLFPIPGGIDPRRPPKERVLGIPQGPGGGTAFPFGVLAQLGEAAAVATAVAGRPAVVFWDGLREAAAAFYSSVGQQELTFEVQGGRIADRETGSIWRVDGLATSGALAGTRLAAVAEAFVAYWFGWAAFYPEAQLWLGPGPGGTR